MIIDFLAFTDLSATRLGDTLDTVIKSLGQWYFWRFFSCIFTEESNESKNICDVVAVHGLSPDVDGNYTLMVNYTMFNAPEKPGKHNSIDFLTAFSIWRLQKLF